MSKTETSHVLAFDPACRRSSRRLIEVNAAHKQLEATERAEALTMGLTETECETNPDLYYHASLIRELEAAYAKSATEGRAALLSVLKGQYDEGYHSGCEDAAAVPVRAWR
jgi:hypothetical protein